uniref:Uncharacterized protein n=1 Tax=Lepeophtheirus salmonis TaxID=72036 RepID=A0A0K2TLQ3_LEPSM
MGTSPYFVLYTFSLTNFGVY